MRLHSFLIRLVWLCVLPLLLLAVYLAFDTVQATRQQRDLEAYNLARNFATAVDQNLRARIGALQMLARSPLTDDRGRWIDLYREAEGFRDSFGSHVILADERLQMQFNTRLPFGTSLPVLPRPEGRAAAPLALERGEPAVGDIFVGPISRESMIAIAVPSLRSQRPPLVLLAVVETSRFQQRLEQVSLPAGWVLSLVDGNGATIARSVSASVPVDDAVRRVEVASELAPWMVVLEIPGRAYRSPLVAVGLTLGVAILGATLAGAFAGLAASRRLGESLAGLADGGAAAGKASGITEIAAVRNLLDRSAEQRVAAEAAQADSERRFRATFEQAAVGIAMVGLDGRWLRVNQKLCDIVGYSRDELLTKSFQDLTHADDLELDLAQAQQVLAGEIDSYTMEKRYLRKSGGTVWVNLTVALVRGADGRPDYFVSVVEDIERRKEAEAALLELNASLEHRVEQRTAELSAANRELDSFAYAVSHDLRAPLRAMSGFSQALVEDYGDRLDGEARAYLEQIVLASRKMGDLIDGVLALSRSARGELRRDEVDVSALAADILADLARVDPERRVAGEIEPGLSVCGDARMVDSALRNLLGNAWKYTARTADARIRVHAGELDGQAAICVSDNGAGFDMAYADRLFQPFRRLHRQDEFPGIGIGLATVQRIVRRHGGEIRATAAPGDGATFCFTLDGRAATP